MMNKHVLACCLTGLALVLTGCAQMIRDEAVSQMRNGQFEAALKGLEEGIARHPDSALLRSSLLTTRSEVVARLVAEFVEQRDAGQWSEAEKSLKRALQIDPQNERLKSLLHQLPVERQAKSWLDTATKQAAAGQKQQALRTLNQLLTETPKHADALALRRQLEAELRAAQGPTNRSRLAETRPISLDFRAAPLASVLEAVTRGSGVNFVLDRDVKQDQRVTVYLRSASVEDALDLILGSHQLTRRIVDPTTVLIYPNTAEKHKEHQEQIVRVFHLANADAKVTGQLLKSMLRLRDTFVDERTNMIAIRESPELVAMAERLVALHDVGEAEVMLEVEILEVKANRLTELGISVPNGLTLTPLGVSSTSPTGGVVNGSGLTLRNLENINSDRIGVTIGGINISLRREVGDFNILANPRIRAKNREKARIVIGDRFPVVTSTANATGFVSESVSYLDVGLKLDVEPVVSQDDDVTIKMALEVSAIAGSIRTANGTIAYQVGTRNANTTLRLRDGETQILAGLISNDDRSSGNRIPGLGDLPIAGRLFSNLKDELQRTELMLAITPRVLRNIKRPDIAQSELWVGTDNAPRLRNAPTFSTLAAVQTASSGTSTGARAPIGATQAPAAPLTQRGNAPGGPPPAARLEWRGSGALKVGEIATVPVHMVSDVGKRGVRLQLAFPPDQLEVIDVSEGTYFSQSPGQTSFTQSVDAQAGTVSLGITRNDQSTAKGNAPLFNLRMRVKTAGRFEIKVPELKLVGNNVPPEAIVLPSFHLNGY